MRRAGRLVALLLFAGSERAAAGLAVVPSLEDAPLVAGRITHVLAKVTNTGTNPAIVGCGGAVSVNCPSMTVSPSSLVNNPNGISYGNGQVTLAPGAAATMTIAPIQPLAPGAITIAITVYGQDAVTNASLAGNGSAPATILSASQAAALHPGTAGTMEVRHNIVRVHGGNGSSQRAERALIVVRGAPGGVVNFALYGPDGKLLGAMQSDAATNTYGPNDTVTLGSDGTGTIAFNGYVNGQLALRSGVYWIVASGAVKDRKPVLVLSDGN